MVEAQQVQLAQPGSEPDRRPLNQACAARKEKGSPRRGPASPAPSRGRHRGVAAPAAVPSRIQAPSERRALRDAASRGGDPGWFPKTPKAPTRGSGRFLTSARHALRRPLPADSPGKGGQARDGGGLRTCKAWRRRECWKSRTRPRCTGRGPWRGTAAGSRSVGRPSEVTRAPEPAVPPPPPALPPPTTLLVWGREAAAVACGWARGGAEQGCRRGRPADQS